MEELKRELQEASMEQLEDLANKQEKFRYFGVMKEPPKDAKPGDMILLDETNKPLIYIDQWYLLPDATKRLFVQEDAGDERNDIIESLFQIVDWPGLPKELVGAVENAIGLLEKDREDLAELERKLKMKDIPEDAISQLSELIADMTVNGSSADDIARAVAHSMLVMDALKKEQ